jgi:cell division protein FtsQ
MTDARFEIDSASSIQVLGNAQVTRPELLSVFGSDIGRNIFHVPLAVRRAELEELPWVEHATVMRLLPNQLRVAVTERTPVAFVREGNQIGLVDNKGVLLNMPPAMMAAKRYSFPVVTGVTPQQTREERASRMQLYTVFMNALASTGANAIAQLSEVDLSDPEDVRVLLPSAGSDLLVHFGSDDFAARWQRLEEKLPEWRQQYPRLAGVDLRYQRQTVLEMAKTPEDTAGAASGQPAAKAPVRPAVHSHAATQRSKEVPSRKQPAKKSAVKKKPTRNTPAHISAAHRGTNG